MNATNSTRTRADTWQARPGAVPPDAVVSSASGIEAVAELLKRPAAAADSPNSDRARRWTVWLKLPRRQGPVTTAPFTMAEIICVFALIAVVFATCASLLSFNVWVRDHLNRQMAAGNVAKSHLERLRTVPFQDLSRFAERETQVNAEGVADAKGGYYRSTTVEEEVYHTRAVTVRVRSGSRLGRPGFEVSLTSVILDSSSQK